MTSRRSFIATLGAGSAGVLGLPLVSWRGRESVYAFQGVSDRRAAVQGFTSADRALVAPEPTFEAPANFAKFLGTKVVAPPVDAQLKIDLNATADAARGAGLIYFCNPNNPTATVHGKADVSAFV